MSKYIELPRKDFMATFPSAPKKGAAFSCMHWGEVQEKALQTRYGKKPSSYVMKRQKIDKRHLFKKRKKSIGRSSIQ